MTDILTQARRHSCQDALANLDKRVAGMVESARANQMGEDEIALIEQSFKPIAALLISMMYLGEEGAVNNSVAVANRFASNILTELVAAVVKTAEIQGNPLNVMQLVPFAQEVMNDLSGRLSANIDAMVRSAVINAKANKAH